MAFKPFLSNKYMLNKLKWNISELAKAMKITEDEVREYFTDGRRVSFVLERRLAREVMHGKIAKSEGAGYDLTDNKGKKWEVRSITKRGVFFSPSNMVGKGRKFEKDGFLKKLNSIDGYILADVVNFPNVPFWKIKSNLVRKWWENGEIRKDTHSERESMLKLIQTNCIQDTSK